MLIIDTRGKQAATVVEKTPIEEDADIEQDPLELAIRTKYVAFLWSADFFYSWDNSIPNSDVVTTPLTWQSAQIMLHLFGKLIFL